MRAAPLPEAGQGAVSVPPCLSVVGKGRREEGDDYPAVVVRLNATWRVAECRDGIQWILQRRAGQRHGQPRWEGKSYFRTRQGLLRRVHEFCGPVDAVALAIVEALPDWMGGRP